MLVTQQNLAQVLTDLRSHDYLALDTETYGLGWNDKLFSLIISGPKHAYYFNFKDYIPAVNKLSYEVLQQVQKELFILPNITWYMHNAKYDMRRLAIEGLELEGKIWDTGSMERFVRNNYHKYGLAECLERRGKSKDEKVEEYIAAHPECSTSIKIPGKKKGETLKHYDKVPFALMYEYALTDARETFFLGEDQRAYFDKNPALLPIVDNEKSLVRAVFNMEARGIQIDLDYCRRALSHETAEIERCFREIESLAGIPYRGGPNWLSKVLNDAGTGFEISDKGNPLFNAKALKQIASPITKLILDIREHEKRITSFYSTYLHLADEAGVVHPDYKIGGTDTGRFSCSKPNMQQLPKKEKAGQDNTFTVREACVPRKGFIYVMMDYDAMEYRLVADYAGQYDMIDAILNKGLDPHSFVAEQMGLAERDPAKTLNFMKVYGGGLAKMAMALFKPISNEVSLKLICKKYIYESKRLTTAELLKLSRMDQEVVRHDVKILRQTEEMESLYNTALPKLKPLTEKIVATAKQRGYTFNRYGRRSYLDNPSFAYAMLNYLIQGTGADVVKHAMVKLDTFLADKKSCMVAQVHDEILYEISLDELGIIPQLREIMETEYKPINGMTLSVGLEWSAKSWALRHRKKGMPTIEEITEELNDHKPAPDPYAGSAGTF